MKKLMTVLSLMTMLFVLSGCGGDSPADKVVKEQLKLMNELADDAEAGKIDPDEMTKRSIEIKKKADALNLTPDEIKKLEAKWKPEFDKVSERMQKAIMKNIKNMAPKK